MATPIKETPILTGKDAERFIKRAKESEKGMHRVPKKDYDRAMKTYNTMIKNADI